MADIGEITIERGLAQIQDGLRDIGDVSRAIDKDLRAVQAGLKFDPSSTELLAQRHELLSEKLENSKNRSEELIAAIAELNRMKTEDGKLTDGNAKLLQLYQDELTKTTAQVTGLTGATKTQSETNVAASESTKTFSQSMTEFQSNLRAAQQVMSGVSSAFKLFGGDENSAMGKMIKQGQQAVQMINGIASAGKLLGKSNTDLSKTFGTVALAAGTAVAAYSLGTGIVNAFGEENRRVVAPIMIAVGALGALAIAGLAAAGVISWGTAVPVITAAIGLGVAGMTALLKTETANLTGAIDALDTGGSVSMPSALTPSVPSYSGGGGGSMGNVTVQTLSERQIEEAVSRAIINTGLNQKEYIGIMEVNGREFARATFNDTIAINTERGNPLKV